MGFKNSRVYYANLCVQNIALQNIALLSFLSSNWKIEDDERLLLSTIIRLRTLMIGTVTSFKINRGSGMRGWALTRDVVTWFFGATDDIVDLIITP